jgi:hypothetical protein
MCDRHSSGRARWDLHQPSCWNFQNCFPYTQWYCMIGQRLGSMHSVQVQLPTELSMRTCHCYDWSTLINDITVQVQPGSHPPAGAVSSTEMHQLTCIDRPNTHRALSELSIRTYGVCTYLRGSSSEYDHRNYVWYAPFVFKLVLSTLSKSRSRKGQDNLFGTVVRLVEDYYLGQFP